MSVVKQLRKENLILVRKHSLDQQTPLTDIASCYCTRVALRPHTHTHFLSLSPSLPTTLSLSHASLMILTLRYSVLPFYSKSWFNRKRSFDFSKKILKPKKKIFFLSEKIIQKHFFQAAVEKFLNRRWRRKSPLNDATLEAEKFSTQKKYSLNFSAL